MSEDKKFTLPSLEELLNAGAHFGHKTSAWDPRMKPYIYTERNGVHIIDLISTLKTLKLALEAISSASEDGGILIVGTKGQAASLAQEVAQEVGAFYVNKRWPGGLFTNFVEIKRSVNGLMKMEEILAQGAKDMVKKEELLMRRDVDRLNKVYAGIKFMDKVPSLMIVIDSKVEKNAIKEAGIANIPVVALLDTNCNPKLVKYPVVANDDSIKSITLFINKFGEAIKGGAKSSALTTMRKEYSEKLKQMRSDYENEVERVKAMQEAERERMKTLREGKEVSTVVRVAKEVAPVKKTVEKEKATKVVKPTKVAKAVKAVKPKKVVKTTKKAVAKKK